MTDLKKMSNKELLVKHSNLSILTFNGHKKGDQVKEVQSELLNRLENPTDELQKLMNDIASWSNTTFGEGQRTVPILYHLLKEVPELIYELECGIHKSVKDEFADCFTLLFDTATHYGLTAKDVLDISFAKLEVNKKRKWGKPDENGVVEHIKDESTLCKEHKPKDK